METRPSFKEQIIYTLLEKFYRSHQFEELTDEVVERIISVSERLSKGISPRIDIDMDDCPYTLETGVWELNELGVQCINALENRGIKTLGELLMHSPNDFARIRGIGKVAIMQLSQLFEKYHFLIG